MTIIDEIPKKSVGQEHIELMCRELEYEIIHHRLDHDKFWFCPIGKTAGSITYDQLYHMHLGFKKGRNV
jgi:tRNA(Ile)-lysidine synthase TilS/MesJ